MTFANLLLLWFLLRQPIVMVGFGEHDPADRLAISVGRIMPSEQPAIYVGWTPVILGPPPAK